MVHDIMPRKPKRKFLNPGARATPFIYIGVHQSVAERIRVAASASKTRICTLLESWCDKHIPETDADRNDDPIVITGQGEYENIIRPSDLS